MGSLFVFVCDKVVVEAWNKAVENYVDCCGRWAGCCKGSGKSFT